MLRGPSPARPGGRPGQSVAGLVRMAAAALLIGATGSSVLAQAPSANPTPVLTPAPAQGPICDGALGYAEAFGGRRTFLLRPDHMTAIKARSATDEALKPARAAVLRRADAALARPAPYTVVDKTRLPASGDPHDYMSIGPYWWPDPDRPDGLPYVRRDGQVNPERATNAFDATDMEAMSRDVQALSLAYYLTDDERYAAKAAELVRAWFLAPETRMNPNLDYAQAVPGREAGRAEGVIDAHRLVRVVEGLGLLDPSPALTELDKKALRDWFAALVEWMATSPNGRAERAARNNHGVYYDMLLSHFALYAGMDDAARAVVGSFGQRRLAPQIDPDGRMPQELARTRSLHYSTWTLIAAMDVAQLGQCVGVDVWGYRTPDGRSLAKAVDFLDDWAGREREWPFPELNPDETGGLYEVLLRGAWAWSDPELARKAELYRARNRTADINLRLPPYAP
ncbi:MAG: alginate lyase family protein [Brevundimonas sp.]|uniref:alginate lyase family protein n=1 Tax=Brevundimonas sp. TaxID=1871086 RepID=UPI004033483D